MKKLLLALALVCASAHADYVAQLQSGYLRLADAPCTHEKVLVLLQDHFKSQFRQAWMVHNGWELQACWIVSGPGEVTVIDQDGDGGVIEFVAFKKVGGV